MVKRPMPFNGIVGRHEEERILAEGCKNPFRAKRLQIWSKKEHVKQERETKHIYI